MTVSLCVEKLYCIIISWLSVTGLYSADGGTWILKITHPSATTLTPLTSKVNNIDPITTMHRSWHSWIPPGRQWCSLTAVI